MTATPGGTATSTPVPTTMCAAFQATAERMPDAVALRTVGGITSCTWSRYAAGVRAIAAGLAALGVRRGEIVDRKKELLITSGGENIAPALVELAIKTHNPMVAQAVVVGDSRPYPVALLVLDPEVEGEVDAAVAAGMRAANATLSRTEQVRAYAIITDAWPPGGELVTPTMKVRRRPVLRAYADRIDALYAEQ